MLQRKHRGIEEGRAYWAMVLPAFLIYLLVMAFPIILSVVLSLSNYDGGKMFGGDAWGFAGLKSYAQVFSDPLFWNALKNNFYIVLISVFGQLPLGFIFAYIIYRKLVKMARLLARCALYSQYPVGDCRRPALADDLLTEWANSRIHEYDRSSTVSSQNWKHCSRVRAAST